MRADVLLFDKTTVSRLVSVARSRLRASGIPRALHDIMDTSDVTVQRWRSTGHIPLIHLLNLMRIAGVSPHSLLPHLYENYTCVNESWKLESLEEFVTYQERFEEHIERAGL